jgi:hypothetical protein
VLLAPLALVAVVVASVGVATAVRSRDRASLSAASLLLPSQPYVLVWSFIVLPPCSSIAFRALAPCECFAYNVPPVGTDETEVCFLSTDRSVICERVGGAYHAPSPIVSAAAAMVIVWAGGVPLLYASLLYVARGPLAQREPSTDLSRKLIFLVDGFEPRFFWWQLVDIGRKLVLIGFLALVEPGSLLQQFIAVVVSLCFFAIELYLSPFNTLVRSFLSHVSGFALVLTLVGTLGLELAQRPDSDFLTTDLMLGVLIAAALLVALAASAALLSSLADAQRVVVARHSAPPHLAVAPRPLAPSEFHCLISHQWGSGQDQASTLKARLQALAGGLRCFLDVEDLQDTSLLEAYVKASGVLVAFLSGSIDTQLLGGSYTSTSLADCTRSDYFTSTACLTELRAAHAAGKPICFVLELDPRHGAVPLEIHRRDCPEELRHLLTAHPIVPWFRAGPFAQVSLRQILQSVLGFCAGDIFIPGEVLRSIA